MKITIEAVADTREEALALLKDAVAAVKRHREKSARTVNACIGDYRIMVEEDPPEVVPYTEGDRVRCVDRNSVFHETLGTVKHAGPTSTGVQWDGWDDRAGYCIKHNDHLEPAALIRSTEKGGGA